MENDLLAITSAQITELDQNLGYRYIDIIWVFDYRYSVNMSLEISDYHFAKKL